MNKISEELTSKKLLLRLIVRIVRISWGSFFNCCDQNMGVNPICGNSFLAISLILLHPMKH